MAPPLVPLTPVDAAWYHMDRPTNEAIVTGLVLTETPLAMPRLREVLTQRLLPFERFRQRVVLHGFPVATPHWEDDPDFDLAAHMHHFALPEPGDKAALCALVGDLISAPLDHKHPLWEMYLIDHVGAGSALVCRYHHCLADGLAMMALAGTLFDTAADTPPAPPETPPQPHHWIDSFLHPAFQLQAQSQKALHEFQKGLHQLTHPQIIVDQLRTVASGVGTAVNTVVRPADPPSPLKGPLSGRQRVAFSDPVPVPALKAIGRATGTTVNDVLIAALSGAVRGHLQAIGVAPDTLQLRAAIPVNMRRPQDAMELGNAFGLTFLELPIGAVDPLERLAQAKQRMDAIKHSPEALVFLNVLALFGQTPKPVEDLASDLFASKSSLVLTNVKGPQQPLYVAGSRIEQMLFFVPHPVSLGLGVSLLSYNDTVLLGVISDAAVLPDPAQISDRFADEVAVLQGVR
jgi:WS/DGAT/MGAT family acyltransferase